MDYKQALQQLTGAPNPINRLNAMVGAKDFARGENSVSFKFKGSKIANHVEIKLNSMDLYDVKFVKIWGMNLKNEKTFSNVYFDQLKDTFEEYTKLYLSF